MSYNPDTFELLTFHDKISAFNDGSDTPRDYLERSLATIEEREPEVMAWVTLNPQGARQAADEATSRYKAGTALSPIDGMPIGIKDLFSTRDMPTQMGSPLFAGQQTADDTACVQALRASGAVILGKTVTTELGFSHPGPTTNPHSADHSPGGSSSGSAAAVGAAMVPAAIGSQVVGSVIRPAGFCGNIAIKPTMGALNRGERLGLSQSHLGVHAGSLEDMWAVSYEIHRHAGGDPGAQGLFGDAELSAPHKPRRLILLETEGWPDLDKATRSGFDAIIESLQTQGVEIIGRKDNPLVEAFEQLISTSIILCRDICGWELRYSLRNFSARGHDLLSDSMKTRLDQASHMTPDDYRTALQQREAMRTAFRNLAGVADGMISLSSVGPAPLMDDPNLTGEPSVSPKTGVASFNAATSAVGCPAVTLPLLSVGGLPVGVQVIGQWHQDWELCGLASWVLANARKMAV